LSVIPNEKTALRKLSEYYLDEEEDFDKGIRILKFAIDQDLKNPGLYNNLGKAYTGEASGLDQNSPGSKEEYKKG
jgi:hypothetical protein